jgi:hypothetical protein
MIIKSDKPPDYNDLFGIKSKPESFVKKRIYHQFIKVFNFCSCCCKRNDNDNDTDNDTDNDNDNDHDNDNDNDNRCPCGYFCRCYGLEAPEFPFFPQKRCLCGYICRCYHLPNYYPWIRYTVTIHKKIEYPRILQRDHDFETARSICLSHNETSVYYGKLKASIDSILVEDFDTTSNSVTMTLPENPNHGDIILVINSLGTFGTNNGIIKTTNSGHTINGGTKDYIMNTAFGMYNIYYSKPGKNWTVFLKTQDIGITASSI